MTICGTRAVERGTGHGSIRAFSSTHASRDYPDLQNRSHNRTSISHSGYIITKYPIYSLFSFSLTQRGPPESPLHESLPPIVKFSPSIACQINISIEGMEIPSNFNNMTINTRIPAYRIKLKRTIFILSWIYLGLVLVSLGIPPTTTTAVPRVLGQLKDFLRLVKKTKVVTYHLWEVLVPIKCFGFYRVTTKKI